MTKISDMLGLDQKIREQLVKPFSIVGKDIMDLECRVKLKAEALKADVYSNMQSIEKQNYRMVEMETKLNNLELYVKMNLPEGGD